MSLVSSIPKGTIVLPSNVRASEIGGKLILTKVKRSRKRFKMSKKQRNKISAASRKFKVPILTGMSIAPAVLFSAQTAMGISKPLDKLRVFATELISYYTGVQANFFVPGFTFQPTRLVIGWGPIVAVGAIKLVAKGRVMAINRALSRAQIPANLG